MIRQFVTFLVAAVGYLGAVVEGTRKIDVMTRASDRAMSNAGNEGRSSRTKYSLGDVPRQDYDYDRQLRGPPVSRGLILASFTEQETSTTEMDQLVAALTELTKFQQEQEQMRRQHHEAHQEQIGTMYEQHLRQMESVKEVLMQAARSC